VLQESRSILRSWGPVADVHGGTSPVNSVIVGPSAVMVDFGADPLSDVSASGRLAAEARWMRPCVPVGSQDPSQ